MTNVKLIYGPFRREYSSRESALRAVRKIAKKENGLSLELKIRTSNNTVRTEWYTYDNTGKMVK